MKKDIKLGSTVDDLSGDYLRIGAEKINSNFKETYENLGDGSSLHAAGAWKKHSSSVDGNVLNAKYGEAWTIDTTGGQVTVNLPSNPTPSDYGSVIKFKDSKGTWGIAPVTINPQLGNYIGGKATPEVFTTNYSLVDLTLADGASISYDYKYVRGVTIDSVPQASTGDSILKKSYQLSVDQQDFLDIFDGNNYNSSNLEVYRNGNLLYYGEPSTLPPSADSDYGSIGGGSSLIPLNGVDVRLRNTGLIGDIITFKTYVSNVSTSKNTYQIYNVKTFTAGGADTNGETLYNIGLNPTITLIQMGAGGLEYNAGTFEVFLNGNKLLMTGDVGSGNDGALTWEAIDTGGTFVSFTINGSIPNASFLEIKWYDGVIGSTLEFEGVGGIKELTQDFVMDTEIPVVSRTNKIYYPNFPTQVGAGSESAATDDIGIRFSNFSILFDTLYPIGTIYKNAHNPANPKDYMGYGEWVAHSVGKVEIGFETGDPIFGINGATGGSFDKTLVAENIPEISSTPDQYIRVDTNGSIDLTGCNTDPNSSPLVVEPSITKIREGLTPQAIDITPSFVVVYSWRRVA